jgi:hypothetical protein
MVVVESWIFCVLLFCRGRIEQQMRYALHQGE